jgi:hypothetical protein
MVRIRRWRDRGAPAGVAFPGDSREWENTRYAQAELSPLGCRLLGLEHWKFQSTGYRSAGATVCSELELH